MHSCPPFCGALSCLHALVCCCEDAELGAAVACGTPGSGAAAAAVAGSGVLCDSQEGMSCIPAQLAAGECSALSLQSRARGPGLGSRLGCVLPGPCHSSGFQFRSWCLAAGAAVPWAQCLQSPWRGEPGLEQGLLPSSRLQGASGGLQHCVPTPLPCQLCAVLTCLPPCAP